MIDVAIIDSGGANLASLQFAFRRLDARCLVTEDPETIASAPRVVLPGVGSAAAAMRRLTRAGLDALLPQLRQPVLGICLGMQLMFEFSEEGTTRTLGILPGRVRRLAQTSLPVPHMGWNTLEPLRSDPLLRGIGRGDYFYFVHSYAAARSEVTIAAAAYGEEFAAIVRRENFAGTQFHPERSALCGARLLRNFLES
jgi:glutamine amidotransferase